ncbi:hypothetical protein Moror_11726 [Moniliophthora roreri MCA 2997]|nr:hypothetical protein Moror_11726 [Moniliophthora roreri MCA 2997]
MLDEETYNLIYKADINTDQSELWSSAHKSNEETEHYSFNNHLSYSIDDLADLTPSAGPPSPSAAPVQPSPLQTPTPLSTPL